GSAKVDLAVTERSESAGPIQPPLIAAVYAGAAARTKLRILDVKRLDARVVVVDERGVVELLQQQVARVVKDIGARVTADGFEEPLERHTVVEVLARM